MLTDGQVRFSYPDGKTEDVTVKAGQVLQFPAVAHLPENIGDKPFETIGVELKSRAFLFCSFSSGASDDVWRPSFEHDGAHSLYKNLRAKLWMSQ